LVSQFTKRTWIEDIREGSAEISGPIKDKIKSIGRNYKIRLKLFSECS
jgi:hypothetical protein